jgi:SAM-dependent methyltransferase
MCMTHEIVYPELDTKIASMCEEAALAYGAKADVHPADHIFWFILNLPYFQDKAEAVRGYFSNGNESARKLKTILADLIPTRDVSMLEFASGYGCVTRHLRHEIPNLDVTACDIHPAAVDFIRNVLGVKCELSDSAPEGLALGKLFQVVFALSFFSHMPDRTWRRWLDRLAAHTEPGGFIIFTTHGLRSAKMMKVTNLGGNNIWFNPQSEQDDLDTAEYGTTITSFDYVYAQISSIPDVRLVGFQEGFWWGHQDVYTLQKGCGHVNLRVASSVRKRFAFLKIVRNMLLGRFA